MTTPAKHCTKCAKLKVLTAFAVNKRRADGYNTWCKSCKNEWYAENRAVQSMLCTLRRKGYVMPRNMRKVRTFAEAIRRARLRKNLSQTEAARGIGISVNTLSAIELRQRDTTRFVAKSIVDFYKLPPRVMVLP